MTDHQRLMIQGYLPHPRDESLALDEYYVLDNAGKCRKVRITDICPNGENLEYGVVDANSGRRVNSGFFMSRFGFRKGHMYDNKEDCRDSSHGCYDKWELLRRLQKEAGE